MFNLFVVFYFYLFACVLIVRYAYLFGGFFFFPVLVTKLNYLFETISNSGVEISLRKRLIRYFMKLSGHCASAWDTNYMVYLRIPLITCIKPVFLRVCEGKEPNVTYTLNNKSSKYTENQKMKSDA